MSKAPKEDPKPNFSFPAPPESKDPKPDPAPPEPKAPEPIKIMGEPKATEPKAPEGVNALDVEKIVSDVFDKKLAQFIQKGPESDPTPTPEPPKSYRLFDEFDPGV